MEPGIVAGRVPAWRVVLLCALSLSIGWGIRGNFGHEHGAMMPGALAAMAAVLLSGREDWHRRIAYFAAFGALGWSFGGSMSYGHVLAYTHSGDSLTIVYGFASLFLIGFLWAALGGAGTALPAYLRRERLTALFVPFLVFYAVLIVHDLTYDALNTALAHALGNTAFAARPEYRQDEPLYWLDTDWTTALLAIVSMLAYSACRRRIDPGASLILHMAVGWWVCFLLFPVLLDWRMTPPRGDNWAGCLGMTVGMWVYLQRDGLGGVTLASLIAGFVGGAGFALATLIQILALRTGWQTNWHSVLEQTYGLINGIGIAAVALVLAPRAPRVSDDPPVRRWTDWFAPAAVLVLVTYLNARKNPEEWVKAGAMPQVMYWLQPITWFNIGYLAVAVIVVWLLIEHMRRPLPILPRSWLGRGQLLYVLFLWWAVIANFERALVAFAPARLITEGVIILNAALCTLLLVLWARVVTPAPEEAPGTYRSPIRRTVVVGVAGAVLCSVLCWAAVLGVYGTRPVDFRGQPRIRFGPRATVVEHPRRGQPHP
ncbi:MAG: hypothetical protein IT208_09365 [Chthonomonadales bacterium]|nr:hypothetical protein [Chthonomonadales bacterium]